MTDTTAKTPSRRRERFPGISTRAWEHPADRSALVALRKLSGFDEILKKLAGLVSERAIRLMFLATAVKTSERQFPELYDMVRDAAYTLDLQQVPDLYVTQDPSVNAFTIGIDTPIIVVTSGLVELLDEEELRSVIGHEVGHAMSGHAVYRTMLMILTNIATRIAWVPLGNLAITAVITALKEWFRKAELSSDRAGLLAGQDLQASMRALMKLAGGHNLAEMNVDAFLEQAEEYEKAGDLRDGVLKLLQLLPQTHPFAVVRVAQLKKWAESDEYRSILAGAYPRREDDREASVGEQWKAAADHYATSVKESKDPLMGLLRDVAGGAATVGGKLRDTFAGAGRGGSNDRDAD
ncbi:Zn-dependent protease with chaperone function [Streptomyces sp. 1114.5]|uniref:M48 family metallopeptidase n=1 Tax=unclassified Streptomyces TaxID=2593676 RepID=UPI000BD9BB77|nr:MULTISPECIES: M48 family metallopeptidase [unclassified Streptomyces]RKT18007.1 Zn-dependent protease with chaperone function [Streptomyces sp. 1114.5]SOB84200.1 Zn-dependent protease with chaperone function [Streptomyces sp. 1331.2]